MRDRKTKDYIGLFFGTVIACFVLTIILHSRTSEAITPQVTISTVFVLCFVSLFVLLGFIHHVALSCIADHVILNVAADLRKAINRLLDDESTKHENNEESDSTWPTSFDNNIEHIFFQRSGYIQSIDYEHLTKISQKNDLHMRVKLKAGHFVVKGEDGIHVHFKNTKTNKSEQESKDRQDLVSDILEGIIVGINRTPTQDIEYSIRHLVEIAIRALSPGINDSFTAMNVLNQLSAALVCLFDKDVAPNVLYDKNGAKRIEALQSSEADIVFNAFDQIRHSASDIPAVMLHLLEKLVILSTQTDSKVAHKAMKEQAEGIKHQLSVLDIYMPEKEDTNQKINALLKTPR